MFLIDDWSKIIIINFNIILIVHFNGRLVVINMITIIEDDQLLNNVNDFDFLNILKQWRKLFKNV